MTANLNTKSLSVTMRYNEGVMTRKEWINLQFKNGATVIESTKNRIDFNRIKYNRLPGGIYSNQQDEYEKKCNEVVVCFKLFLKGQTSFFLITKTEFNYFNSLKTN